MFCCKVCCKGRKGRLTSRRAPALARRCRCGLLRLLLLLESPSVLLARCSLLPSSICCLAAAMQHRRSRRLPPALPPPPPIDCPNTGCPISLGAVPCRPVAQMQLLKAIAGLQGGRTRTWKGARRCGGPDRLALAQIAMLKCRCRAASADSRGRSACLGGTSSASRIRPQLAASNMHEAHFVNKNAC